jgi:RNA polymerase sigma-70 factor (ECF subfamily)
MEPRDAEQDRADVRRVRAGDVAAFEGIVRRWQGPLVNLAYRFCRDPGRAEEMAQDALLRAYRFLDRWRDDSRFSTWLFAIAINVYRSQMRRLRPAEVPLDPGRSVAGPGDPAGDAEAGERTLLIRRAVAALPARYRDPLVLFYFLDADVAKTARCLGVPQGTVKARLHRGRELLARRLSAAMDRGWKAEAV